MMNSEDTEKRGCEIELPAAPVTRTLSGSFAIVETDRARRENEDREMGENSL